MANGFLLHMFPHVPVSYHARVASTTRCPEGAFLFRGYNNGSLMGRALAFLFQQVQGCIWGPVPCFCSGPLPSGECSSPFLPLDHSGTPTTRFSRSWGERGLCTLQPGLRWCQTWGRPVSGWSPRPHGACRDERRGGDRDLSDRPENPDSWGS